MAGHRPAHEALILSRGAGSPQNPDHHREDPDLGVWTATRNGEDVGLSWAESGVPHGNQYRRGGLQVLSTGSSSPRIDNFIVQDIAADDE